MKRKIPLLLLCLVFLSMTIYSGYRLLMEYREYKAGEEVYDSLSQYIAQPPNPTTEQSDIHETDPNPEESMPDTQPVKEQKTDLENWPVVDFEALQNINPDVVAWIYQDGTVINYPVVQGEDNNEYMYQLVDGTSNRAGSIFMDYRNLPDFTRKNTILYGHNRQDNSMFASVTNYKDQSFYDAYPACMILTPGGNYKLEFFAGFVVSLDSDAWKLEFGSDEEYEAWLERAVEKSDFQSRITPTSQDRVVTLSTCSYEFDIARYVLHGVLRPADEVLVE